MHTLSLHDALPISIGYWLGAMGGGDMAQANIIYNLADFINKIAFGLAIYVAAVSDSE